MVKEKINLPFNIKKINHLADIHIRNLSRHKEYIKIFNKFIDKMEKENAITIIVGDIVHSKINISNELYQIIIDLFMKIMEYTPLFFIAGNHDLNEKNLSRLDSLYIPYIMLKENPKYKDKIFYLKESGIYPTNNFDIIVYSIYDNIEIYEKIYHYYFNEYKDKKKKSICLFHGAINGSKLDNNQIISSNVNKTLFEKYDFVLLGDIHKRQSLI